MKRGLRNTVMSRAAVLAMSAELGDPAAPVGSATLDDDPVKASYEAAARAPLGPLDAQRLLELDDPGERFARLEAMLTDTAEGLELRLAGPISDGRYWERDVPDWALDEAEARQVAEEQLTSGPGALLSGVPQIESMHVEPDE